MCPQISSIRLYEAVLLMSVSADGASASDAGPPPAKKEDPLADVKDVCLLKCVEIEPWHPDPLNEAFTGGFRVIFSLKERRGLRTASKAVLLTQTLVPLQQLLSALIAD